ncbi:hypothetical protein AUJ66_00195 [Candidatus Desantisbacteria bacterium CG1_02_38_46]|uniref:Uncharacterized protein n=2 Tax=unclassified Candidatus Desantisiibacteriota TaxID=3106372 RepID=A0A2H9PB04_9BACT|nr:MAG: hypothetical protein AUJ66_00195 [Candidatus Desantisbacteria bacterium CG1_02_38_46]PIZ15827.1 MAG: hypothetical protein COY51_04100 [Candidatus Desantisbacteria bacterium CG_4_10_14_0_8_um_filter_39_17]
MVQNPILKVLFTFQKFGVKSLLIGGQACIIYGAAEFSRDSDFVIFCNSENLAKLKKALRFLKARNIYLPPLKKEFLEKGHACHFRCYDKSVKNLRVDVISKLRGCDDFQKLWERRFSVRFSRNRTIEIIGLQDLAQSKKTQRDKDWLMLNRLIENDIFTTRKLSLEKIKWWLYECRSSSKLIELARKNIDLAKECSIKRPLLKVAFKKDIPKLEKLLQNEELLEREKDRKYWELLRKELEMLRHKK